MSDRRSLAETLEPHWFEYIGEEEGFDCGCNEDGQLGPWRTQSDCARHLADVARRWVLDMLAGEELIRRSVVSVAGVIYRGDEGLDLYELATVYDHARVGAVLAQVAEAVRDA